MRRLARAGFFDGLLYRAVRDRWGLRRRFLVRSVIPATDRRVVRLRSGQAMLSDEARR